MDGEVARAARQAAIKLIKSAAADKCDEWNAKYQRALEDIVVDTDAYAKRAVATDALKWSVIESNYPMFKVVHTQFCTHEIIQYIAEKDFARGCTILHIAARHVFDQEFLEDLVAGAAFRACINKPDRDGWTPIICACHTKNMAAVEVLAKHGADLNARNEMGNTAILMAADVGNTELMLRLIALGADHTVANDLGFDCVKNLAYEFNEQMDVHEFFSMVVSTFPVLYGILSEEDFHFIYSVFEKDGDY